MSEEDRHLQDTEWESRCLRAEAERDRLLELIGEIALDLLRGSIPIGGR